MPTYRCFVLDKESHISERLSIESDSDDYAITQAGAVLERRPDMAASRCGMERGWYRSSGNSRHRPIALPDTTGLVAETIPPTQRSCA